MTRKKPAEAANGSAAPTNRISITKRFPRELWERLENHVAAISPRTTETAIMELALQEYLDRNEVKKRKEK